MTQAWRPCHISSPTGRPVSRIARAAIFMARFRVVGTGQPIRTGADDVERASTQPMTPAPWRSKPSGRGPLQARAIFWSRSWVLALRSWPGSIMLSIIWMLAPTHWTKFFWATKSARRPRSSV